ncbi:hypothetical protein CLAIMM_09030 [Cladophialophora immunda]|nr:hypothetical protein CLAIMM_09030 [Cladophialophora immunda]
MTGAQEIPVIVVTPPPEDGPTSTVGILTARHWGLWARGALRKLDRTSAKGQNYSTKPGDDVELVELPGVEPTGGKLSTDGAAGQQAEGKYRQVEAHDRPAAAAPLEKRTAKGHKNTKEPDRHRTKEVSHKRLFNIGLDHAAISESDRLIFCKKHSAVLESIRFRGEMMHAFEQECKQPWYNGIELEDDLASLLPSTKHIRMKAEELLKDFAENPIPDIRDVLEDKRQRKPSVCKVWREMLETHEREYGETPLFEPVVLDDWKEDSYQTWGEILDEKSGEN